MTRPAEGVLDTSAVIALPAITDPQALPEHPLITAITLAELAAGPLATDDLHERARRQTVLQQAEHDFHALPFDDSAARAFVTVAASLRASGRKQRALPFDALIAATALAHGLPVYTANPANFAGIPGLAVHEVTPEVTPGATPPSSRR